MNDDAIGMLLESVYEENTEEQLRDENAMLAKLKFFLGLEEPVLRELIFGAQIMRALRGHRLPVWAQLAQEQ